MLMVSLSIFSWDNMNLEFVDNKCTSTSDTQIVDIQMHKKYNYYGNISWKEGNSSVTETAESKSMQNWLLSAIPSPG